MDDSLGDDPFPGHVAPRIGRLTSEAQRKGLELEPRLDGDWDLFRDVAGTRTAIRAQGSPAGGVRPLPTSTACPNPATPEAPARAPAPQ
jgi:hypothetical protein